jgi:hypothetical protein
MLITLGALVAIDYAGVYGFWRTWPILIIVFGLLKLLERASAKPAPPPPPYSGPYPVGNQADKPAADRPRQRNMRRGSVIGPLILIGLGVLFLFRNLWPEIPLVDMISRFWPFLLIAWGGIRLLEILFWSMTGKPCRATAFRAENGR